MQRQKQRLPRRLGSSVRRFARDTEGAAMLEFILLVPILVLMLFVIIALSHAMIIDRKVTITAQAAADLVSQRQAMDDAAALEIAIAAELMLQPFEANFDLSIAHVPFLPADPSAIDAIAIPSMEGSGAWRVLIGGADQITDAEAESAAAGGGISAPESAVTGALGRPGDALVLVRMNYQYQAPWLNDIHLFGITFPGTMTFSKLGFARPRLSRQIAAVGASISATGKGTLTVP